MLYKNFHIIDRPIRQYRTFPFLTNIKHSTYDALAYACLLSFDRFPQGRSLIKKRLYISHKREREREIRARDGYNQPHIIPVTKRENPHKRRRRPPRRIKLRILHLDTIPNTRVLSSDPSVDRQHTHAAGHQIKLISSRSINLPAAARDCASPPKDCGTCVYGEKALRALLH